MHPVRGGTGMSDACEQDKATVQLRERDEVFQW